MKEPFMSDYPEGQDMDYTIIPAGDGTVCSRAQPPRPAGFKPALDVILSWGNVKEDSVKQAPAPDLSAELASLRADIAAVMALIQAGKVAEPAVEAVAEVAPDDIAFEPSIAPEDITIEPDVPDKAIEERIDKLIQGFDYKQTVKEAVEVALAKLTGRVI
jgi:hypothetical protein